MMRYPRPLSFGDTIAVTAPSDGVSDAGYAQLHLVMENLRSQGYKVIEGCCLRGNWKDASASAQDRANELMRFLCDDSISAVIPPIGGGLAIEVLPLLDFEKLSLVRPKWMLGFSDITLILLPLTLLLGWASAHGALLICLPPDKRDEFASNTLNILRTKSGDIVEQQSSTRYTTPDYNTNPISLKTETTQWKTLAGHADSVVRMKGRLIGGCIARLPLLAGTKYGDIPAFVSRNQADGVILYLENTLPPIALAGAMLSMKMNGWFDSLAGVLIGRNLGDESLPADKLSFHDVLIRTLGDLACPVLIDVDFGHTMPQMTLINGAFSEVSLLNGIGRISQKFC